MKAVLISIKPKWVEKIASGEKTIEVRKTRPKIETPFKCYIYCTKGFKFNDFKYSLNFVEAYKRSGKVIGEFVCDNILHSNENAFIGNKPLTQYVLKSSCLTMEEINQYRQGKNIYAWHISQLKIYDKPKELREFYAKCNIPENKCKLCDNCYDREDYYGRHYAVKKITRPPQSWCYVEDLGV